MNYSIKDKIIVSSLFHDIGKVVFRSKSDKYKHNHQEYGYEWAEKFLREFEISNIIKIHHSSKDEDLSIFYDKDIPKSILAFIVYFADNLASGERDTFNEEKFNIFLPLKNIFSEINLDKQNNKIDAAYFSLFSFKDNFNNLQISKNPEELKIDSKSYENILKDFENEISKIKKDPENLYLYYLLLEKYFSFMPSFTVENKENSPDISLFDHLKMTCAISLCIYNFLLDKYNEEELLNPSTEKKIKNIVSEIKENNEKFLLIKGDLSGIQKFIYSISSSKALKHLRSRSFYIQFLNRVITDKIIEKLNLFDSNILYCGGGNFLILSQNTLRTEKILVEIEKEVNDFLFNIFDIDLFFSLNSVPLTSNNMNLNTNSLNIKFKELNEKNIESKKKKFITKLNEILQPCDEANHNICSYCFKEKKVEFDEEGKNICDTCKIFINFGIGLKDNEKIYLIENKATDEGLPLPFNLIGIQNLENINKNLILKEYIINSFSLDRFNFKTKQLMLGNYVYGKNENKFLTLEEFVTLSEGAEKLAGIRMDVDNLGKIFREGLGERNTLTRISVLSRYLSLFFNFFINQLDYKDIKSIIIYSGGDDIFALTTYDTGLNFSKLINNEFNKFSGFNPQISLSGGIVHTLKNYPVYLISKDAENLEYYSKVNNKRRITINEENINTFLWEDIDNLIFIIEMFKANEEILTNSFLQKIYKSIYTYIKNKNNRNGESSFVIPKILYEIARYEKSIKKEELQSWINIKKILLDPDKYKYLNYTIYEILLRKRKKENNK